MLLPFFQTEFAPSICRHFEVVAFTAGQRRYSGEVLRRLDPEGRLLQHRLYREHCYLAPGPNRNRTSVGLPCCPHFVPPPPPLHLKPLSCLGRDLDRVVVVDNFLEVVGFDVKNAVVVKTWTGDPVCGETCCSIHPHHILSLIYQL